MRILAISGSLRRDSHNTLLLRAAAELLAPASSLELWEGLREVPPYDQDDDVEPAPRRGRRAPRRGRLGGRRPDRDARVQLARSRARSRTRSTGPRARSRRTSFRNKPVAVIGASAGLFGAVWAQAELRKVLAAMGARVVEVEVAVGRAAREVRRRTGSLVDDEIREQLATRSRRSPTRSPRASSV